MNCSILQSLDTFKGSLFFIVGNFSSLKEDLHSKAEEWIWWYIYYNEVFFSFFKKMAKYFEIEAEQNLLNSILEEQSCSIKGSDRQCGHKNIFSGSSPI